MSVVIITSEHLLVAALTEQLVHLDGEVERAETIDEALARPRNERVQLVIIDSSVKNFTPSKIAEVVTRMGAVVALVGSDAGYVCRTVVECGGLGAISRHATVDEVRADLARALSGRPVILPAVINPDVEEFVTTTPHLTLQQEKILRMIANGRCNKQIACELGISPGTVKVHISNINGVLGTRTRWQALSEARRLGLLGPFRGSGPDLGDFSACRFE